MSFFRNKIRRTASTDAVLRQSRTWRWRAFYNRNDGETLLAIAEEGLRLSFYPLETIFGSRPWNRRDRKTDRSLDGNRVKTAWERMQRPAKKLKIKTEYFPTTPRVPLRLPAVAATWPHLILTNSATSPIPEWLCRTAGVSN